MHRDATADPLRAVYGAARDPSLDQVLSRGVRPVCARGTGAVQGGHEAQPARPGHTGLHLTICEAVGMVVSGTRGSQCVNMG